MTDSASLIPFHPQSLSPCHLTCFLGAVLCACHTLQLSPSREIILNTSGSHQKPQGGGMLTLSSLHIKLGVSCSCSPLSCCACSRTTSPFKQRGGPSSRQNGPLCALGAELQPPATTTPVLNLQEGTLTSPHGIHPPWHRDKGSRTLLGVWCVTALHWGWRMCIPQLTHLQCILSQKEIEGCALLLLLLLLCSPCVLHRKNEICQVLLTVRKYKSVLG